MKPHRDPTGLSLLLRHEIAQDMQRHDFPIRERDTLLQERIPVSRVVEEVLSRLKG